MALAQTVDSDFGVSIENAYHRVEGVQLVTKDRIFFSVKSYKDVEKPNFASCGYECFYDLDGDNPIKQAYEYLKTLPKFADATDC